MGFLVKSDAIHDISFFGGLLDKKLMQSQGQGQDQEQLMQLTI